MAIYARRKSPRRMIRATGTLVDFDGTIGTCEPSQQQRTAALQSERDITNPSGLQTQRLMTKESHRQYFRQQGRWPSASTSKAEVSLKEAPIKQCGVATFPIAASQTERSHHCHSLREDATMSEQADGR